MTIAISILLFVLIFLRTLASYVERIYTEMGKFLSREFQENIEAYELKVEPLLNHARNRAPLSMAVLAQLSTAGIAMCIIYIVVARGDWEPAEIGQALLAMILIIV